MWYQVGKCQNCHEWVREKDPFMNLECNIKEYPDPSNRAYMILSRSNPVIYHKCEEGVIGVCPVLCLKDD